MRFSASPVFMKIDTKYTSASKAFHRHHTLWHRKYLHSPPDDIHKRPKKKGKYVCLTLSCILRGSPSQQCPAQSTLSSSCSSPCATLWKMNVPLRFIHKPTGFVTWRMRRSSKISTPSSVPWQRKLCRIVMSRCQTMLRCIWLQDTKHLQAENKTALS